MTRQERRRRTKVKLQQRERMIRDYGLQQGTLYAAHREKIQTSLGYMKTGNVRHYVAVRGKRGFPRKRDLIYDICRVGILE